MTTFQASAAVSTTWLGSQIPGGAALAPPDHESQGPIGKVGMGHRKKEDAAFHIAAMHGIKDGARSQATFATRNFPRRLFDSVCIEQMIVGLPAQDKTRVEAAQGSQPPTPTIAAIKHMDEAMAPASAGQAQELAVFIFLITSQRAA